MKCSVNRLIPPDGLYIRRSGYQALCWVIGSSVSW